jgi:1-hydroxycarotenoid 3,4-desaturase
MVDDRVVIVGAGIGGLVAALTLAARGLDVTVVERQGAPGGKMREVRIDEARIDAGPTVLTMRWVLEEIFADAGASLDRHLTLRPLEILARHAWSDRERLDLFADRDRAADAIGAFAGAAEAGRYRQFSAHAQRMYATLEHSFIRAPSASPLALIRRAGPRNLRRLWDIRPFSTLWQALEENFTDPRLRQLFGRYATYCGSSPFLAPATLMLIAHVEQSGVWTVEGGMHRLAVAVAAFAATRGARFRYNASVVEVIVAKHRVAGVRLSTGEVLEAGSVVVNADVAAISSGRFGRGITSAVPATRSAARSLSAITWNLRAPAHGFPLHRHNVFFSRDYAAEFTDLFQRRRLPRDPTVYVCAQDRDDGDADGTRSRAPERLLCLVNAPPTGDGAPFNPAEIAQCEASTFGLMTRCGLLLERDTAHTVVTTPTQFEQMFPATGGALYGRHSHGWMAAFQRPPARTRIAGLYVAGGSTHPGPGVPMAALSGRMAAEALLRDLASTSRSRRMAMPGGMSMR